MEDALDKNDYQTLEMTINNLRDDALLGCLEILCLHEHKSFSEKGLTAGLPLVDNRLTPMLFQRAAKRAGFESKIVQRELSKISNLVLPMVLLLDDDQACVLKHIDDEFTAEIIFPEASKCPRKINIIELEQYYTGRALFVQPIQNFDKRATEFHELESKSWFWGTLWKFKRLYWQALVCSVVVNLIVMASPLFIMNVYDRVVPNYAYETLWVLVIGVSIAYVFDLIIRVTRGCLLDIAGQKVDILLASHLYQRVLGMNLRDKPASAGAFANNVREFDSLREFFTSATLATLADLPFSFMFLLLIAYLGGALALVPLLIAPLVIIIAFLSERPMRTAIEEARMGATQKHAILVESISEIEMVKALSAEGILQSRWESFVAKAAKAGLRSRFFSSFVGNFTNFSQHIATVIIVLLGVYLIESGDLSMGGLIACVILSGRALAPLSQATNLLTRLESSKMALHGLDKIMTMPQERNLEKEYISRQKFNGTIEFDNVTFTYPGQSIPAIQNLSFKINAGERVALIGRIGSGKSSVLRLIVGLYPPSSGSIRIDGIDIAQLDPAELRDQIGYAAQDNPLFFGTVRENILMRNTLATDARIIQVSKISGVDQFVRNHPEGYDMNVGERGSNLSGGQRQAINIARALLPNISMLLLDEPTAAIDQKSEKNFASALNAYLENETFIMSTHRGSMLDLVDRVIIIDGGKIIADGSKEKVLNPKARSQV